MAADDVVPSGVRDLITADERHLVDQIIDCVSWLESGKAHAREYATRLLAALQQARQERDTAYETLGKENEFGEAIRQRFVKAEAQLAAQDAALQGLEERARNRANELEQLAVDLQRRPSGHDKANTCYNLNFYAAKFRDDADQLASVRAARREGVK